MQAPAVSTKLSGIAIHSACHGPVARSKSCTMASSIRPACWRTALRGQHQLRRDRVALLRHGRGCAAPLYKRLVELGEFGRGHDHDVEGDLAEPAGHQPEEIDRFGRPSRATCQVETGTPSPSPRTGPADLKSWSPREASAPRRRRTGRPARAASTLRDVRHDHRHCEPYRGLVAEGDRQRLLEMGPTRHRRIAVAPRQPGEDAAQRGESSSISARPSRSCRTRAVSMMSCVVAPQ